MFLRSGYVFVREARLAVRCLSHMHEVNIFLRLFKSGLSLSLLCTKTLFEKSRQ